MISVYCTGLGEQCGKKNLLHCAPSLSPKAELWALTAHVHKTTYGPLIDTALYVMHLMQANPLLGQVGGGWALEILPFFGSKWHSPNSSLPFHRAEKIIGHCAADAAFWAVQQQAAIPGWLR